MEGVEIVESIQRAHSLFRNDGEEERRAAYEEEEIWDEGAVEEDEGTPLDEIEDLIMISLVHGAKRCADG